MRHYTSGRFWKELRKLPPDVQQLAIKNYRLLLRDPRHPSIHFERKRLYWSARVGLGYRALAIEVEGGFEWFWIGSHADYDRLVR
jgi:hypothetical protein